MYLVNLHMYMNVIYGESVYIKYIYNITTLTTSNTIIYFGNS